jgi:hypothetical protein
VDGNQVPRPAGGPCSRSSYCDGPCEHGTNSDSRPSRPVLAAQRLPGQTRRASHSARRRPGRTRRNTSRGRERRTRSTVRGRRCAASHCGRAPRPGRCARLPLTPRSWPWPMRPGGACGERPTAPRASHSCRSSTPARDGAHQQRRRDAQSRLESVTPMTVNAGACQCVPPQPGTIRYHISTPGATAGQQQSGEDAGPRASNVGTTLAAQRRYASGNSSAV